MATLNRNRFSAAILIICLLSSCAISADPAGFEIMRTEVSGQGAAVAGAMVGYPAGLEGIFYNPAALTGINKNQAFLSYQNHLLDINTGSLCAGRDFGKYGYAALGINYINYGDFKRLDIGGQETGENYSASDVLVTAGYARRLSRMISLGINLKFAYSSIWEVSASAAALDLGILVETGFHDWVFGGGVYNLGQTLSGYYDYKDSLPLGFKLGLSKPLEHLPLTLMLMGEKWTDSDVYFSAGGQFTVSEMLRLRLGWTTRSSDMRSDTDEDLFAGASAGLGLMWKEYRMDFALNSFGGMGTITRFTLGAIF